MVASINGVACSCGVPAGCVNIAGVAVGVAPRGVFSAANEFSGAIEPVAGDDDDDEEEDV